MLDVAQAAFACSGKRPCEVLLVVRLHSRADPTCIC